MTTLKFEYDLYVGNREMLNLVSGMLEKPRRIIFSMFNYLDNSMEPDAPVCLPNITSEEPVINGEARFMIDYWRVSDEPIYSRVYVDPTWRDIINACNNLLQHGDGLGV